MKGTLNYNQRKVNKETARILGTFNMPEGDDPNGIRRTFEWYEWANIRTEKPSFQMSINPDPDRPGEKLTDAEALSYAKRLMDGLGYKDQPIVIYEHHDIERVHYHVVSIRTDENGKKIKDSFEKEHLQRLMARYAKQYHYVIGNQGADLKAGEKPKKPSLAETIPKFDPKGGEVRRQYTDLFEEAMTYEFRTWTQFSAIMEDFGVQAGWLESDGEKRLTFQGLGETGETASHYINEMELAEPLFKEYQKRLAECSEKKALGKEEKSSRAFDRRRAAFIFAACLEHSRSEEHFRRMLANKGYGLSLSYNDKGDLFGATVVDHTARRAYKLSELDRGLLAVLQETERPETGRWDTEAQIRKEEWLERKRAEREAERARRRQAHIQSNMDLAAQQAEPADPGAGTAKADKTDWLAYAASILEAMLTGRTTMTRSVVKAKKTLERKHRSTRRRRMS